MKTIDQDTVAGSVLIVLGLAGIVGASSLENLAVAELSAAFFPCILFGILIFCGICLLWQASKRTVKIQLPIFNCVKLGEMLISLIVYLFLMYYLGFIIATIIFLVAAMYVFGERRKKILFLVSVAAAVMVYFLFAEAFMIVLPGLNI